MLEKELQFLTEFECHFACQKFPLRTAVCVHFFWLQGKLDGPELILPLKTVFHT